jgi:uncharacterized protein
VTSPRPTRGPVPVRLRFPYGVDASGRTAVADSSDHLVGLIEQLLFTSAGERVNRPTLGSGIGQLVFSPHDDVTAAAVQFLVESALQQWLGDVMTVDAVRVVPATGTPDGQLTVAIVYHGLDDPSPLTAYLTSGGPVPAGRLP